MMADLAKRRLENTRGTLGAGVNLDGTLASQTSQTNYTTSSQRSQSQNVGCGSIFGDHEHSPGIGSINKGNGRHGPGIQTLIFSDASSNMERKRAMQQELAQYERMQREEKDRIKMEARKREIETEKQMQWPFGHGQAHAKLYSDKNVELAETKMAERRRAEQYARDLTQQIEDQRRRKPEESDKPQAATYNDGASYWRPSNSESHRRRVKKEEDLQPVDPISLAPVPARTVAARRMRQAPIDERKDVYPLYMPGDTIPNTLDLGNSHPKITADTKMPRQRTDVNTKRPAAKDMNLHEVGKDDPNEPGYFHFGRPGNGAPILDEEANLDPRLLSYKSNGSVEKPFETAQEPRYGRKKVLNFEQAADKEKADILSRKLRFSQEEDLKIKAEINARRKQEDLESGKKFAENYPWSWGGEGNELRKRVGNARHRTSDIVSRKSEPVDREKAMQYRAELDRLVEEKRAAQAAEAAAARMVVM